MADAATPVVIDPLSLSRAVTDFYHIVSLATVNDHEIRMSVMTERFRWHRHPDSDETFYGIDGEFVGEARPVRRAAIPAFAGLRGMQRRRFAGPDLRNRPIKAAFVEASRPLTECDHAQ